MPRKIITTAIAFTPWILSMYLLFRLDADGIWSAQTADRDIKTIALLITGMALTFVLLSVFSKDNKS